MRKTTILLILFLSNLALSQTNANRFFYELKFKQKKNARELENVLTVLDVLDKQSTYKDYTYASQDSIMKIKIENAKETNNFTEILKKIKNPKISYKVIKKLPSQEISFIEVLESGTLPVYLTYNEIVNLDWKIENSKENINNYDCQKATLTFGGRKWIAWFTNQIPISDGPYKFHGLPGLIVKIEDNSKNFIWQLVGNYKITNYQEFSEIEKLKKIDKGNYKTVPKIKFAKAISQYAQNPFAMMKSQLTKEMLNNKVPGTETTLQQLIRDEELRIKALHTNENPIEITNQ
ncbi:MULTISPECIES: GLPGLI family protein [Amniculibacterium]|jgi:GLPGLI family protein|uniref:GLPGLI family protein n=1 Tax=Amniculibacterium TaxID=2715289 RepID=UPI000F58F763|nr:MULTISPECIES: GLPGLI family protein [Amniculibacterium]